MRDFILVCLCLGCETLQENEWSGRDGPLCSRCPAEEIVEASLETLYIFLRRQMSIPRFSVLGAWELYLGLYPWSCAGRFSQARGIHH